jgi:hypothetical protein
MIKLLDLLKENKILVPRRSSEERQKNYVFILQKQIQQYIKNGSKGNLYLSNTPITSLPDNLQVGNGLDLSDSKITSLPDNLQVGGDLDLSYTPITSLPSGLKIGGNLSLRGSKITSLPSDLQVGDKGIRGGALFLGKLHYLKNTQKKKLEQ